MIQQDQPTCFPDNVSISVSSTSDGTVLDRAVGVHNPSIVTNRTAFCERCGISYGDVVFQRIIYDETQAYDIIVRVDALQTCRHIDEVHADALITQSSGVGLLLPVADCVATVLYDPKTEQLALAHLGRHSTIARLMEKTIEAMVDGGALRSDIIIWMAPSIDKTDYKMAYFDQRNDPYWQEYAIQKDDGIYLDLQGYNAAAAVRRGVLASNIHRSPVNTARDNNYFSHANGDTTGRFAVLAMIRP